MLLHFARIFLFYFCPWPFLLNVQTFSSESVDIFSMAAHIFPNCFNKNIPSIWANFDHVFEVFLGLFFAFL